MRWPAEQRLCPYSTLSPTLQPDNVLIVFVLMHVDRTLMKVSLLLLLGTVHGVVKWQHLQLVQGSLYTEFTSSGTSEGCQNVLLRSLQTLSRS